MIRGAEQAEGDIAIPKRWCRASSRQTSSLMLGRVRRQERAVRGARGSGVVDSTFR